MTGWAWERAEGTCLSSATATFELEAGEPHDIELTASGGGFGFLGPVSGPLQVRLAWVTPERRRAFLAEAVEAASAASAVVVFAYDEGTEGRDRVSLALAGPQEALVAAVAAANPRTTVVLNTGDPVLMPWLDETGAVLQMWYPGQEGADIRESTEGPSTRRAFWSATAGTTPVTWSRSSHSATVSRTRASRIPPSAPRP